MKHIINAHDKLFKEMQSIIENSRDLIESVFPKDILENLDLETLKNDNNSYIDQELKEYYSDLVFSCVYNNSVEIKISILFEHKSYKPKNEYLQLLQYILNIWNYAVKKKKALPVVIPMIYYHGKEKWDIKPIFSFFPGADDGLKHFIPSFEYILTDLAKESDKEIEKKFNSGINKVLALLFKHMADEEYIKEHFKYIFSLLIEYFRDEKRERVISFLLYIMNTTEIEKSFINKSLGEISPEGGDIAMTTAMKIRQEGKLEGKQEGKLETAEKMLKNGADIDFVLKVTDLPRARVEQIINEQRNQPGE